MRNTATAEPKTQRERGANTLTFPRHLPPSLSFSGLIKSEAKDQMGLGDTVLGGQPLSRTLEGSGAQRQSEGRWGEKPREINSKSAAGGSRPSFSAARPPPPHPTSPLGQLPNPRGPGWWADRGVAPPRLTLTLSFYSLSPCFPELWQIYSLHPLLISCPSQVHWRGQRAGRSRRSSGKKGRGRAS